jgi:hypothetical protein
MADKHVVLVSRKWDHPSITIDVSSAGIGIGMSLESFLVALARETKNPALAMTRGQLLRRLVVAAEVVTQSMKDETGRVM